MEIEDKIADMPDGIEADILRKRYIEFKQWEQKPYREGGTHEDNSQ